MLSDEACPSAGGVWSNGAGLGLSAHHPAGWVRTAPEARCQLPWSGARGQRIWACTKPAGVKVIVQ